MINKINKVEKNQKNTGSFFIKSVCKPFTLYLITLVTLLIAFVYIRRVDNINRVNDVDCSKKTLEDLRKENDLAKELKNDLIQKANSLKELNNFSEKLIADAAKEMSEINHRAVVEPMKAELIKIQGDIVESLQTNFVNFNSKMEQKMEQKDSDFAKQLDEKTKTFDTELDRTIQSFNTKFENVLEEQKNSENRIKNYLKGKGLDLNNIQ